MSEEQIVAQMRTTISAGYETVSAIVAVSVLNILYFHSTLTCNQKWTLYELSRDPELQHELREEISTSRDASFDDLNNKYPLLDAILKEILRLHPAILENHHEVSRPQ